MYIPVIVQIIDDVIPGGQVDIEFPHLFAKKITSCYNCGSLVFYQVVSKVEGTESATDTEIYCAVCGKNNGGIFNDPFDEMDLKGEKEEDENTIWGQTKWDVFWDWLLENIEKNLSIKYKSNSPCFDLRELLERKYEEYYEQKEEAEEGIKNEIRVYEH